MGKGLILNMTYNPCKKLQEEEFNLYLIQNQELSITFGDLNANIMSAVKLSTNTPIRYEYFKSHKAQRKS